MATGREYPLALAFELAEFGAALRAQRHRRDHPEATEAEVTAVVAHWFRERPGAPDGDADGRPILYVQPA